jgi:AraC-like DNA-binding protein
VGGAWERRLRGVPAVRTAMEGVRVHGGLAGPIRHSVWVLDYNFLPAGLCRVGSVADEWIERSEPAGHLYPPGTSYWEDTRGVGGVLGSTYVQFTGGGSAGLDRLAGGPRGFARFEDPEGILGQFLMDLARTGHEYGEAGFWKAQAILFSITHCLLQSSRLDQETYRVGGDDRPAGQSELVQAVREYLAEDLSKRVTLEAIAGKVHVSVSTLSHRYSAEAGETPMRTLGRMRMNVVRGLLLRGHRLKNIAAQTGFCDEYHLSRFFKKNEGVSPRAWLRQQR